MSTLAPDDPATLAADAVAARLGVDPARGLSAANAARRLREDGPNAVRGPRRPPYARIAMRQLVDPLVALLVSASAVSVAVGDATDAAVIMGLVVLNAVLGFAQESRGERAMLSLTGVTTHSARVIRDGSALTVPAEGVVRGDVVLVDEGDRVPADARLIDAERLAVDESLLTGESVPVEKRATPVAGGAPLAERASLIFSGTGVTRGRATAVVVATGSATEIGRIATLAVAAHPPPTPLQRRLRALSRGLVLLGLAVTLLLAAGLAARGATLRDAFLVGVAVAVAAVPEGLAATVTIALAQGARSMAARGAIVRRLAAVETLGSTTVIATDKTGTLTRNELRLAGVAPTDGHSPEDVLRVAALASLVRSVDGRTAGDPVDVAVVEGADVADALERDQPPVLAFPFEPERRCQAVAYRRDGALEVDLKGAPERLIADLAEHPPVQAALARWTHEGLKVLAVARRRVDDPADLGEADVADGAQPVGLIAVGDPLRPTAAPAIATARRAGVRTVMLTGDHPATAGAIGREVGLDAAKPLTGPALAALSDERRTAALRSTAVFARVTPQDKLDLVRGLQRQGEVVAVTGDGVNDAPALRAADVGVAMGRAGTEAAREAADIVLTDDDYSTIVAAIAEGRRIGANLRKFVAFLLSANLGEVILFAVAVAAGLPTPMTVVQVLTINLLTDGLPALALARDPLTTGALHRGPLPAGRLFSTRLRAGLALAGVAVGASATVAFLAGRALDPAAAQTIAFATLTVAELAFVFSVRSSIEPAWRSGPAATLAAGVFISLLVLLGGLYTAPGRELLGTTALGPSALAVVAVAGLAPALIVEAAKAILRSRGAAGDRGSEGER